jgi:16S rRNA (cytosine967-C5)-methyltransferase
MALAARPSSSAREASPARRVAYTTVRRTFEQGAYTDRALDAEATRAKLDSRSRAQATRLAFGAVQWRATLDHLAGTLAERPVAAIDPPLRAALRLGLYELLWLSGAPDRAVVFEAVALAGSASPRGAGLVNAVLRRATREGRALLDALDDETPERAALAYSHPVWVAERFWEQFGADGARALMRADNEPAESALRANALVLGPGGARALIDRLGASAHPVPGWPDAVVLDQALDVRGTPLWEQGAFTAQSRAAQLVAPVLGPRAGERVLDLCSAPGGKATHLAALMGGSGHVLAVERHAGRGRTLRATCARLRAGNVEVLRADAREAPRGPYDRVLLDPPCSGLGTLQSHPDLRWRVQARDVPALAAVQGELLAAAGERVRPGGTLVYSTCTLSPAENEVQIEGFLASHPQFELRDVTAQRPGLAHPRAPGCLLTLPHRDGTAGFFIASLERRA